MTIQNEGIGYKDLDDLFSHPCDLEFIIGTYLVIKIRPKLIYDNVNSVL